jgi:hypothetical protein
LCYGVTYDILAGMDPICQRCGRKIPKRRLENGQRVGREVKYHSDRCQAAAKQERYRKKTPTDPQDRIHLRNLVAHGMIAERLLNDPSVIATARQNLDRWTETQGDTPALKEWRTLLETGDRYAILLALLSVDEEGMRLRSSSPFTDILGNLERHLIFTGTRK